MQPWRLCGTLVAAAILCSSGTLCNKAAAVGAQSLTDIGTCTTSSSPSHNEYLQQPPTSGDLYVRLGNNQETDGQTVTVYFQPETNLQCQRIGTAAAHTNTWTLVGRYTHLGAQGGAFVVDGSNDLFPMSYGPSVMVLVVPDPAVCVPTSDCVVTYQGQTATLEPKTVSTASSDVKVSVAGPLADERLSAVDYYADNQYLYSTGRIHTLNLNYLPGGVHTVTIRAHTVTGQTLVLHQTIDRGDDSTGLLALRSWFYRLDNKAFFFLIAGIIIVMLALLLDIARWFYKHRKYAINHGLRGYVAARTLKR